MALRADVGFRSDASPASPLRVVVVGLRAITNVQGGIEMHARRLYPLLARLGCDIEVVQRSPYAAADRPRSWHGVRLKYAWAPKTPGMETAVHSLLGVLYAAVKRPDILHLHAVGPASLAPLARALGLRVVVTHHAADYEREKWGRLAKLLLRSGERLGMRYANRSVVVSKVLQDGVRSKYGVETALIPNGAPRACRAESRHALTRFGLEPGRYVLCVARMEPEKRPLDLIEAFERARLPGWKLAIVGNVDEQLRYTREVLQRARRNPDVVVTGFQTGKALRELYSHCGIFVLPSSCEGHPIALLEALSYGRPALASAIPENLVIPLPRDCFFPVGDTAALAGMLERIAEGAAEAVDLRQIVRARYSWRRAAQLTRSVYEEVVGCGDGK